ncbi:MAG: translocation/assembly module TamB domain-containing protein [Lamprobacter sp.]|uniref:translocation/assembly module TamB domain-containing protein n=1 Tax=Lamprobacter sp. TaxID=3100796 RepID=UPI002B261AAA|nr:translocation/assembly module TamB domain-containing protein [Lamprobacter sp.]MEA3641260.1 translocation/assembly module TamB domain-containing protein [Lamprobacter sp.]
MLTLVVILTAFLLGTETGLRTLFVLADDLAPGSLKADRVEGRVLGRFELTGFGLSLPGLEVSVGALLFDWSPTDLFSGRLRIQQLKGSDIAVVTEPAAEEKPPSEPFELPAIWLPIGVDIDQLRIERLSYQQAGAPPGTAIELTRAELSATASDDRVDLRTLTAELLQPQARVQATGQLQLDGAYPISLSLDWCFQQAPAFSVAGEGQVSGDLEVLLISHRVTGSVTATLQAQVKEALTSPNWQAEIDLQAIDLPQILADAPPLVLQAQLKTEGHLEQASVTGSLAGTAPDLVEMGRLAADLDIEWASRVLTINALRLTESPSTKTEADSVQAGQRVSAGKPAGVRVDVSGRLDTNPSVPVFAFEALWEQLRWPLAGPPIAESPQGLVEVEGSLDQYAYRVNLQAFGPQIPETEVALVGTGDPSSTEFVELSIKTLNGLLSGKGQLGWSPQPTWNLALTAKDLDPGQFLADWPGSLGGRLQSEGGMTADGLDLSVSVSDFAGQLRGYPVALGADVTVLGEAVSIRALEASSGETRLSITGRIDQQLDLRYLLNSPRLAELLPELRGSLKAEGSVAGSLQAPQLSLTLEGRDIELSGQGIERLDARAELGRAPESPLQLRLDGRNLTAGGQRFEVLQARGQGSTRAHQLSVDVQGDPLSLELSLDAGLSDDNVYRGRLTGLSLETREFDTWRLRQPAPFSAAAGVIEAGPLCLGNALGNAASTSGCVSFKQPEPGRFSASLDLQRLGFDLLDAITPDTTSLSGYLTAKADFEGQGDLLTGRAELRVPEGGVEILLSNASETLVFRGTRLDIRAAASGMDARFELPVEGAGQIDAEIALPGFRLSGIDRQALNGRVRIGLDRLDRFAKLAPDISDVGGRIEGDLGLSGRLTAPVIQGNLAVRDLALTVPAIGLEVADLNLTMQSESADAMQLSGGALVGGGRLSLEGRATGMAASEPNFTLELEGRELKVANTKEYLAILSLDLEAGFGLGGSSLRGELSLPTATIRPRSIAAGAVHPSPDVVMEGTRQDAGPPISIDVLAKLGDQVLLEAFGLRGLLQGQLRLTQQPGKPLLGNGELQVVDGTYRVSLPGLGILTSVGRPLVIEKGILLFANTPLDNPGIILNAQREGGDITAGVRILGTLRNPKLAFFSESDPNLSQSEITSYLVTGIPPKSGGRRDDRSVSVGTYIAPKLFMEYDTSLGEQSDSIKMRYDLTKRIQVESETGDAQGIDFFYKFEN